ncbi:MAG: hypothetical protein QME96_01350 [Myxococcota bacterium]|nr:hypothetical protein [Myxococcota bacterium]
MVRILVYRRSDGSLRDAARPELPALLADDDTFVSPYGYLMVLGLMAAVGAGMLLYLRLRKWL